MSLEEREDVQNANHIGQFHQHFTSSFCLNILLPKNYKAKLKLEKSCAKGLRKMLMTLTHYVLKRKDRS